MLVREASLREDKDVSKLLAGATEMMELSFTEIVEMLGAQVREKNREPSEITCCLSFILPFKKLKVLGHLGGTIS